MGKTAEKAYEKKLQKNLEGKVKVPTFALAFEEQRFPAGRKARQPKQKELLKVKENLRDSKILLYFAKFFRRSKNRAKRRSP
jgi:hypothetical protein